MTSRRRCCHCMEGSSRPRSFDLNQIVFRFQQGLMDHQIMGSTTIVSSRTTTTTPRKSPLTFVQDGIDRTWTGLSREQLGHSTAGGRDCQTAILPDLVLLRLVFGVQTTELNLLLLLCGGTVGGDLRCSANTAPATWRSVRIVHSSCDSKR